MYNPSLKEKLKTYLIQCSGYPQSKYTFSEIQKSKAYYESLPYTELSVSVGLIAITPAALFIIGENLSSQEVSDFPELEPRYDQYKDSLYLANLKDGDFEFYHFVDGKWKSMASPPPYKDLIRYRLKNQTLKLVIIKDVTLKNFTVFKDAHFSFSSKLNIITGENGSGKSHLIKILYAMNGPYGLWYKNKAKYEDAPIPDHIDFSPVFKTKNAKELISFDALSRQEAASGEIHYYNHNVYRGFSISPEGRTSFSDTIDHRRSLFRSIFLPAHDVFSFLPFKESETAKENFYSTRPQLLLFDYLQREDDSGFFQIEFSEIVEKLEQAIHGKLFFDKSSKTFKLKFENKDSSINIDLVADGWKKIGILFILLNNQLLQPGCVLFWDEPEANLNPKLIRLVAACIVELAEWGVQIFLTTHSLFLMREIELLVSAKKDFKDGDVRYFNLLGGGELESGNNIDNLKELLLLDESLKQTNRYLNMNA